MSNPNQWPTTTPFKEFYNRYGRVYAAGDFADAMLLAGATFDWSIRAETANIINNHAYLYAAIYADQAIDVAFYENTTINAVGVAVPSYCMFREAPSGTTPLVQPLLGIARGPVAGALGTRLPLPPFAGTAVNPYTKMGGAVCKEFGWIINTNVPNVAPYYLIRVIAVNPNPRVYLYAEWYVAPIPIPSAATPP